MEAGRVPLPELPRTRELLNKANMTITSQDEDWFVVRVRETTRLEWEDTSEEEGSDWGDGTWPKDMRIFYGGTGCGWELLILGRWYGFCHYAHKDKFWRIAKEGARI